MIELFEGVPGAGKSYYCVEERIIPWLKAGRRVWCRMKIVNSGKWAQVLGITEYDVNDLLRVHDDISFLPDVGLNDAIVIDDCQDFFKAGEKLGQNILEFFGHHRHKGIDAVLICHSYSQLPRSLYVMPEAFLYFRSMSYLGFKRSTQVRVRGGATAKEVIRSFKYRRKAEVFDLYRSFDAGANNSGAIRVASIWKSYPMKITAGVILIAVIIWWGRSAFVSAGGGGNEGKENKVAVGSRPDAGPSAKRVEDRYKGGEEAEGQGQAEEPEMSVTWIIGSAGYADGSGWRFLLCDGRSLSLGELSGEVGSLGFYEVDGQWRVAGAGVRYGSVGQCVN